MQFAIPHAPRRVRFFQVPGAVGRLVRTLFLGTLHGRAGRRCRLGWALFVKERSFFIRSEEVVGLVSDRKLPPMEKRVDAEALLEVLYSVDGVQYTVSGVRTSAEYAEGLGHGAQVTLLVDPKQPDKPREARFARASSGAVDLLPWGLGVGALGAIFFLCASCAAPIRAELEPLRLGALVWLTPDGPLPETRRGDRLPRHLLPAGQRSRGPRSCPARPRSRAQRAEGARRRGASGPTGSASSTRSSPAPSAGFVEPPERGGPKICRCQEPMTHICSC